MAPAIAATSMEDGVLERRCSQVYVDKNIKIMATRKLRYVVAVVSQLGWGICRFNRGRSSCQYFGFVLAAGHTDRTQRMAASEHS